MQNREKSPVRVNPRENMVSVPLLPSEGRSRLSSRRNFFAASTLGLAALVAVSGQLYSDNALIIPEIGVELLMDQDCAVIPESAREKVILNFESPNNPRMDRILKRADRAIDRGNEAGIQRAIGQIEEYRVDMAENYGLTLHDPSLALEAIDSADSASVVFSELQGYMEGFGIKLTTERDFIKDMAVTGETLDMNSLPPEIFKIASKNLITSFSRLPEELVRLADVRRIVLWSSIFNNEKVGGTNKFNNTMHLPISILIDPEEGSSTVNHELGHGIDNTVCGSIGATRDTEYSDLNSAETTYGAYNPSTDFMYSYGGVSVEEDKATVYEFMLDLIRNPHDLSPVVQEKQKLLLARLEANIPGISDYLRSVSNFDPEGKS